MVKQENSFELNAQSRHRQWEQNKNILKLKLSKNKNTKPELKILSFKKNAVNIPVNGRCEDKSH